MKKLLFSSLFGISLVVSNAQAQISPVLPGASNGIPSATTSQLYGGTGSAGSAQAVTVGSGLSLSGGTLSSTGGGGTSTTGSPYYATNYGAVCNGSHLLISASTGSGGLGVSTFAQAAAYRNSANVATLAWMTHANLDYRASLREVVDAPSGSTTLYVENAVGVPVGATVTGSGVPASDTVTAVSNPGTVSGTLSAAAAAPTVPPNSYTEYAQNKTLTFTSLPAGLVVGSKPIPQAGMFWDDRVDSISGNTVTMHWGNTAAIASGATVTFQPPSSLTLASALTTTLPSVLDGGATLASNYWVLLTNAATDAQLAQSEMDWVGQQSAIEAGFTATTGGTAVFPAGKCINDNANNTGTLIGTFVIHESGQYGADYIKTVDVRGAGTGSTLETWPSEMGSGRWGLSMGDPGASWATQTGHYGFNYYYGVLSDMSFIGPSYGQGTTWGVAPSATSGVERGARRSLQRVAMDNWLYGMSYEAVDHTQDQDLYLFGNGYGVRNGAASTSLYGNDSIFHMENSGNTVADILSDKDSQWNSDIIGTNYLAYAPYAWYLERGSVDNYSQPNSGIIVNSKFDDFNLENNGGSIFGDSNDGPWGNGTPGFNLLNVQMNSWGWGYDGGKLITGTPLTWWFDIGNAYGVSLKYDGTSMSTVGGMLASIKVSGTGFNNGGMNIIGLITDTLSSNSTANTDFLWSNNQGIYSAYPQVFIEEPGSLKGACGPLSNGTAIPIGDLVEQNGFGIAIAGTSAVGNVPLVGINLLSTPATSRTTCWATSWTNLNVNTNGAGPSSGLLKEAGSSYPGLAVTSASTTTAGTFGYAHGNGGSGTGGSPYFSVSRSYLPQ